jgi:O-methyltransferase
MANELITSALRRVRRRSEGEVPEISSDADLAKLTQDERFIVETTRSLSITSTARIYALIEAVRYCTRRNLEGAFAECGVWRGGSVLAMILTLQQLGVDDRDIYLYDTFEGMTEPTEEDVSDYHPPAVDTWTQAQRDQTRAWPEFFGENMFDEAQVRKTVVSTGYPEARLHFVRGPVEETLPARAPERLALLRLDTDWYESTRHELLHLYPVLAPGGVLIIDDYGHWEGCRRAVDEYFADLAPPVLLNRIDYTGRIAIKN